MTFNPQDLKRLIDEHGKDLTFTVKGSYTYDTATGAATESGGTTHTVKGYFFNYAVDDTGTGVQRGDRRIVLPLVDTSGDAIPVPESGDTLSGEGDAVSLVSVEKIMSGSSAVCYIGQVRE